MIWDFEEGKNQSEGFVSCQIEGGFHWARTSLGLGQPGSWQKWFLGPQQDSGEKNGSCPGHPGFIL